MLPDNATESFQFFSQRGLYDEKKRGEPVHKMRPHFVKYLSSATALDTALFFVCVYIYFRRRIC